MKTTKYILTLVLTAWCAWGTLYAVEKSYYNSVDGKSGTALREALTTLTYTKHTTDLGYDWTFDGIDIVNGEILDIYSTCSWTLSQQGKNYSNICDGYNREHVVPQSLFHEAAPQKGDRHHLFLTDGQVNNLRSSYPFGETNVTTAFSGYSNGDKALGKLGTASSGYSGTVYEPDDEYKGDIARAVLYMVVRYATSDVCRKYGGSANSYPVTTWDNAMFSKNISTNYGLSNNAIAVFLKWHRNDPVSAKEIARNNGVEKKQGNRNPFIDLPDLVEYLWGNHAGETVNLSSLDIATGGGSAITTYEVTLNRHGAEQTITCSGSYTLPTSATEVDACEGWTFAGWSTSSSVNTTTLPSFKESVSNATTLYAVYSHSEASSAPKRTKMAESQVASVTFTKTSDGNTEYTSSDNIKNNVVSSSTGVNSYAGSKVYEGTSGAKIGSKNNSGYITLNISSASVKTVKVTAVKYGSDASTITVTAGSTTIESAKSTPSTESELTFTAEEAIDGTTSIKITTSKRAYISSITVYEETSGGGGGSTTTYMTLPTCGDAHTITMSNSGSVTGGTFEANATSAYAGATITLYAEPISGYTFGSWTVTNNSTSATISVTDNQFTMPDANVTVSATFNALPTYDIKFYNNGTQIGSTQSVYQGGIPDVPVIESCEGYTFVGWWTESLASTNTTAKSWIENFTVSKAQDYYAVFEHTTAGGGSTNGTKTFTFSSIATANSWENGVAYTEVVDAPVTIIASGGGNNGKWYSSSGGSWRMYSGGTVNISVTSGSVTSVTSSPNCTFTISNGSASFSPSARTDYTSITVNYTAGSGGTTYYTSTTACPPACTKLGTPSVTATPGNGQITLTWADVTDADHYTVTIGQGVGYTTECGSAATIGSITHSGTTNTCVITNLTNGLTYTTNVVANASSSTCDSDADSDSATPQDCTPWDDPTLSWNKYSLNTTTDKTATKTLSGTTHGSLSFESSNTDVLSVNGSTGAVTAVGAGEATVIARWTAAGGYCEKTMTSSTFEVAGPLTISFDANGGSGTMTDQTVTYKVATAIKDNAFSREGYSFIGWATSAEGEKVYNDKQSVTFTNSLTLYAKWQLNSHNVSFTPSPAGATVTVNGQSTNPQTAEYGATVTVHITPAEHYTITSVSIQGATSLTEITQTGSGETRTFTMPDENVTVSVNMTAESQYTATFYNSGTQYGETQTGYADEDITAPVTSPEACDESFTFVGWVAAEQTSETTSMPEVLTFPQTMPVGDVSFYALYRRVEGSGGGEASVIFKTASSDSGTDRTEDSAIKENLVESYTGISSFSASRAYLGKSGVKLGASGGSGYITLNLSSPITTNTITVNAVQYSTDAGYLEIKVNGSNSFGSALSPADGTLTFTNASEVEITDLTISTTSKRAYVASISLGGGGTSYYTTSPVCVPCDYQVTLTKGAESHGTFTLNKANGTYDNCKTNFIVTVSGITPDDGYYCSGVTATGGSHAIVAGPDGSGNYTVSYTKDNTIETTITAIFDQIPTYTVTWSSNGDTGNQDSYKEGEAIIFPPSASGCDGKVFMGWSAVEVAEQDEAPEYTTSAVMGNSDITYYAVFATAGTGGSGGELLNETFDNELSSDATTEFADNTFANFPTGNSKAYKGAGGTIKLGSGSASGHITSKSLDLSSAFTVSLAAKYYNTGGDNANINIIVDWGETSEQTKTITKDELTGSFKNFSFNFTAASSTSQVRIETSTKRAYIDNVVITSGGGTTYSGYTTSCTPCESQIVLTKGTPSNGTFSLNKADGTYDNCRTGGLVVTVSGIEPADGYQFKEIRQTGIDEGVTIDNDAQTVTYDKDVDGPSTITVVFELKPTYTIRFYNGESLIGSSQTVVSGNLPSVPSNPEACEGYTFVGWWTTALPASNTESHIWVTDFTATGNRDYCAIYRHNEGGSGSGTESVTFSDIYTSNTVVEDISIAIGTHTSVTFTKGGSDTQYYTNGNAIRWYGGGSCVVASDAGNITGITFTFGSGDGSNEIEAEGYVEPTWTGEASSVTFTQSGTSGNRRIAGISVTVDGGGTAHYTSVFSCSGHTITVAEVEHGSGVSDKSRCDEGGTVTITLTADEGYECGGITTSPVVSTTETSECTYTFSMPDANITVTPVFTPKTPRTFTFEKGTGICATSTLTEAVWNGGVTLPTATANSGCEPEYVFAGWATAATAETEVRPTLYAAGTLYNGEETTLYAVYSQTTGGSASGFTLSYTHNDVTYYVAARTGSNTYMDASTDAADAARFSIVTSNDKKYLCWHGENDTYVHNSANNTTLKFTTELASASEWTVTEEGTSITLRNSSSGRYFMFNTNQKDRFSSYASEGALTKGDAGTTVYNTNPSCICYSVNITYNANGGTLAEGCGNVVGGECERDWKLCDAPTREGYLFTNWKDQNGTLYNAGATVQDLRLSLTLTAQWIPAPYTVLFNAGSGSCVESLTESSRGDGIILPKAEPSPACADDWTFIGWSETNLVGETNTSATIIGVAGVAYTPETNYVTLYAVYSTLDEGGATPDYTRVTDDTPAEGDYAIVVAQSDESFGLLTYGTIAKGRLEYTKDYTSLPVTTISSPEAEQIWHLTYDASGYAYLYNANAGAYLAASGSNIDYNASAGSAFVLTKDPSTYGDYECLNSTASGSTNYYLGANKDADYIRYYGSTTLIALNSVTLYKGSTGTRYYSTAPVCTPCTDPEWSFELGTSVVKTKGSEPFTNTVIKGHESTGVVTYSSTNEAVATVDAAGLVTMHETGTTTITLRLSKAMPYCATVLQYELEVKEPSIDIVGVTEDGKITIEHDLEGTITIDLSEGNTVSTGTAANDLFFSKYFEAASNMKLFAIFNGTGHDMDLTNIRVRCNCTTDGKWPTKTGDLGYVELRTISKLREQYPKLKIPSGTELIFWSNNKGSTSSTVARNTELRNCITFTIGEMEYIYADMEAMEIPNWFCLGDYTTYQVTDADGNNQFVFNGDDSMILERYNPATRQWELIDVFGAGTSEAPADTEGLVENIDTKYEINGVLQELNDGNGFHAECAGNPIPLSTNRYMLVRKNTVLDGMHAVASNTTSFATLCEEWNGTPVGGSADGYCRSGNVFSDIAEYDYAENYIDWTGINDDAYTVTENADGTVSVYFNTPLDLDARACSLLKIEVHDKDDASKILATTEYKIPIVVKAGTHMTTDDLFKNQGEKCATCDVAILGSATLTKATDGATNDMPEVRDIYVYGGGQLIIPAGTHYRAHDLIMRMEMAADKVNVAVPDIRAVGSLSNQYGGAIRQQVRVGTSRFYQFAVPYPVRLEDVTFSDGRPAVYGEDFMIRYYDGESRAQNLGTASNWKNFEGTELQPGAGYTLAVAKKAGHEQRELIFPMADASLAEGEPATKTTAIHAWGDNTIRANHRGWNFLSNPYLTTYGQNHLDDDAGGVLTTGRLVEDPDHPGWWVNDAGTIPYVTLINGTRTDYTQERVALQDLPPFTTFFIQAGDDTHNSGEESTLTFNRDHRATSAPAYMRAEQKAPVARFGVLLNGNNATDNCGMAIGEDYSAAYDMQADLSKEFGSAYSLKLYTLQEDAMRMAFLATHPDSLNKPIPVGVRMPANAEYTFSIDRRYHLGAFAHIYLTDNVTSQHTDLLEDTYSFAGTRSQNDARFSLFVVVKKDTPTGTDNLLNGIYAVGREGSVMLTGLPETADIYIYDMNGRLVLNRHTHGATSVTYHMPIGVYQIRIHSEGANALLRTIVH